jgi:hypothetical protein
MMDERDLPVLIFRGGLHSDVISLRAVLDVNEIETSLQTSMLAGMGGSLLYVRKRDEIRARRLMEEFLREGQRPTGSPRA